MRLCIVRETHKPKTEDDLMATFEQLRTVARQLTAQAHVRRKAAKGLVTSQYHSQREDAMFVVPRSCWTTTRRLTPSCSDVP